MKLALSLITKGDDELKFLKNAVASLYDYVDGVFITTNHEDTETKKWASKLDKIKLSHLDWNKDFATQRNFNFSQVPSDYDFIVWMDYDDVIINPQLLRDYSEMAKRDGFHSVFFTYIYGAKFDGEPSLETYQETELIQSRERLIKPGSIVWKKRIHETPVPVDSQNYKYTIVRQSDKDPIAWLHLGASRDASYNDLLERQSRNKELLELELEDERKQGEADPRTLLYLMKIYADEKDSQTLNKCLEMGKEYLTKSGWDEERAVCCSLMSKALGTLNRDSEAKTLLHKAIDEYPYPPILYLYLARAYFNLKDFRAMKHWLKIGMSIDTKGLGSSMSNILEMKVLSAELMFNYYYFGERDIRKALEALKTLTKINPTEENKHTLELVSNQVDLDIASEHTHKLMQYLVNIQAEKHIPTMLDSLPKAITTLPFAQKYYTRFSEPKIWAEDEICYYASFGGNHFEKWDGNSLGKGIGGSETAVVRLAEEWTKLGYRVTVYCDPEREITVNGVKYLPYYQFNPRDKFNIFIQWRGSNLAQKISAKKFLVDLHDVFNEVSHLDKLEGIDYLMVKSQFHSDYAPSINDLKKKVISNGIL